MKKRLQHRRFPVKFAKILRTTPAAAYEFCFGGCVRIVSASKYIIISNQCIKVNVWSIAWCCIHSKIMPELDSSKYMLSHALLLLLVFEHGFIQIHFGIFEFFRFCFMSNKIFVNTIIKFYTTSFLCKHKFFIDVKRTQWMLGTKAKVFHESISCFMKSPWNCISWNALKERFHSVSFPLCKLHTSIQLLIFLEKKNLWIFYAICTCFKYFVVYCVEKIG